MTKPDDIKELRDLANLGRNVSRLLLEQTAAQAAAGQLRDPAGAARNAAVITGIALDKLHAIEDRPDPPSTEHRDGIEILRAIQTKVPGFFIDEPAQRPTLPPATDQSATPSNNLTTS
jgi:hypothetical protein